MKGRRTFTKEEAEKIRILLDQKCKAPSDEQKGFRDELRKMGFYISDFTDSKEGFTSADFNSLIECGQVIIVN